MEIEQLIKINREDERKNLATLSISRLENLAAHILANKLDYAASAALLESEAADIERQAQEWNHV
ncbi:DUF2732 family protein [Xenorhabdus thuongxuanensis]|uniref:DUF2732 domain-containing protein n=1 Tax=Xenorhabdus thuongxuanensis TaxID=1873484 RepID=A0A1Q5TGV6_9GAMM|nr:DUF2732 family protein [Xenorhabdus thuongxuanensis]OKO99442.1 hypothetical protein Xentx_03605 [Xenorhabdus thuongxuanensis]